MPSTQLTFADRAAHRAWLAAQSSLPAGFRVGRASFDFTPREAPKPARMNLTVIALDQPTTAFAALFTRNAFPGAPVLIGRTRLAEPSPASALAPPEATERSPAPDPAGPRLTVPYSPPASLLGLTADERHGAMTLQVEAEPLPSLIEPFPSAGPLAAPSGALVRSTVVDRWARAGAVPGRGPVAWRVEVRAVRGALAAPARRL